MLKKLIVFTVWFIAFSAALSLIITITANSFDYGREPGGAFRAGEALLENFGAWYSGSIMVVAALAAAAGVLFGKLPGAKPKRVKPLSP